MDLNSVSKEIREEILKVSNSKQKNGAEDWFREEVIFLGAKVPDTRKVGKAIWKKYKKELSYDEWISLFGVLWRKCTFEEGLISLEIMPKLKKKYSDRTLETMEYWIDNYITNWAHCDDFCNHIMYLLIERHETVITQLYSWFRSQNRWKRRASVVSMIPHARKGKHVNHVLALCNRLMLDKDDMVQKGVGWTLKELSKADKEVVINFLQPWKKKSARLLLRYACEKMNKDDKKRVLSKD